MERATRERAGDFWEGPELSKPLSSPPPLSFLPPSTFLSFSLSLCPSGVLPPARQLLPDPRARQPGACQTPAAPRQPKQGPTRQLHSPPLPYSTVSHQATLSQMKAKSTVSKKRPHSALAAKTNGCDDSESAPPSTKAVKSTFPPTPIPSHPPISSNLSRFQHTHCSPVPSAPSPGSAPSPPYTTATTPPLSPPPHPSTNAPSRPRNSLCSTSTGASSSPRRRARRSPRAPSIGPSSTRPGCRRRFGSALRMGEWGSWDGGERSGWAWALMNLGFCSFAIVILSNQGWAQGSNQITWFEAKVPEVALRRLSRREVPDEPGANPSPRDRRNRCSPLSLRGQGK